jgi:hypothetical protein
VAGQGSNHLTNDILVGSYKKEDVAAQKKRWEQVIAENMPSEYMCWYNSSTGEVDCDDECPALFSDEFACPEAIYHNTERALSRLNMRRFLTLAFSDPNLAKVNNFIPRDLVMSHL